MRNDIKKLTLAAMFLAIGQVLPFITGQIPEIGRMLCPMHFPILLCGFFCGWQYAGLVGFICPLLRSVLFSMPAMQSAIGMAFELCAYGIVAGLMSKKLGTGSLKNIFIALITAMVAGRIVWGLAQMVILGIRGTGFTFAAFLAGAITNAIPGIILQLILIPLIVNALKKYTA
ncbi:MAG: ECF transporter S component [Solobacterium sp.]|nr:ECF transporter S component [Solobacterium sp.]